MVELNTKDDDDWCVLMIIISRSVIYSFSLLILLFVVPRHSVWGDALTFPVCMGGHTNSVSQDAVLQAHVIAELHVVSHDAILQFAGLTHLNMIENEAVM